ncbi:hypothetical protein J0H58_11985 [bacterium]|nr:hypothetical protein [bacterium]
MPELESLVAAWREQTAKFFAGRRDALDELECHLWDTLDALREECPDHGEAFRRAVTRLGLANEIATEFTKIPTPPLPWRPVQVVWTCAAAILILVGYVLAPKLSAGGLAALLAGHMGAVLLGYAASVLLGGLALSFLFARLVREPAIGQRVTIRRAAILLAVAAAVLTGSGIALGTYCPFEKNGWCYGLDSREVGGLAIAMWDLLAAGILLACRRPARILLPMTVSAAGCLVVVLGWIVAASFEQQHYGLISSPVVLLALVAALGGAVMTAFLPGGSLRVGRS